ncbi:trypsin-like serine protease [Micromonospora zamorensis]|uniref:trypsin-like serine protease n=1 Tax=Micromonospora zamorensis TaxID=709883 RepID=UPI00081FED94|nr:trypsin-like serine protease [Micromonospora zamorensis]WTE89962.1 trypsin-like serine protease [Micromonospora zamorensis]SCG40328.1 Repeat domain-containing protein [Micromonospora zamorensis]
MSSSYRRRAAQAGLLAATLVAGLLQASSAQAVTGGTPVTDGSFGFVAKVDVGSLERSCSGSLVDPWWVLTAKSCFSFNGQAVVAGKPTKPTTVTVGRPNLTASTGAVVPAFRIVPHPDRDLVLVRMARRVDVTPVALGAAPKVGEQLTGAGFGRTASAWVPDQLHSGSFGVQTVGASTLNILGSGQTGICRGDLGGPTVRVVSGKPQLVGVHYSSWQGGCFAETETRRDAVDSRVDDLAPWFAATMPQGVATDVYEDLNFLYTFDPGQAAPTTFPATSTGGFADPIGSWKSTETRYNRDRIKVFNDDFDGDGIKDVVALSTAADGSFAIDTFITQADGKYGAPLRSWTAAAGWGHLGAMKMASGDFNGDGRADLTAFYGYKSGTGDEAWINWIARPDGGFDAPSTVWQESTFGTWGFTSVFAGDVNGDGRADASLFYRYSNGAMSIFTWPGQADGKFGTPYTSWSTPADKPFAVLSEMKVMDGDFNGDGRGDVAVLKYRGFSSTSLHTFTAKADGNFNAPVDSWSSTDFGHFASMKLAAGDYNGDKRDDLAVLYKYADEGLSMNTLTSTTSGGFNAPFGSWLNRPRTFGWWVNMRFDGE